MPICTIFLGDCMSTGWKFSVGDILELKKEHPCGEKKFTVLFAGSDIKICCTGCKREMVLPRIKLEKSIRSVIPGEKND